MGVIYSPKTIKDHDKSFNATVSNTLNYINDAKNNHDEKIARALEYAEHRIKLMKSLEKKFKKYHLKYKTPIHENSIEELKSYVSYLESELIVSAVGMVNVDREELVGDCIEMTREVAELESYTNYLDIVSREYMDIEEDMSVLAPKEADNKEEVTINFKDIMANKKKATGEEPKSIEPSVPAESKEVEIKSSGPRIIKITDSPDEEVQEIPIITHVEAVDTISPDIFKGTDLDEEAALDEASIDEFFNNKFLTEDELDPKMVLKSGHSLASMVETIYGGEEGFDLDTYLLYIYNYSESNKNIIDREAYESDREILEVMQDPHSLTGMVIDLPYGKELDINRRR